MINDLYKIIKDLKGSLIVVSVNDNNVLDKIYKNKCLDEVYSLDRTKMFEKKEKSNKNIKINKLRKLKKKFKNKLDYMICDVNGINLDLNRVLYNTYNIIGKKIIYYGIYDEYDVDRLIKKYKRFGCNCDKKMYKEEFILEINTKNIKVSKLFIYKIIDLLSDIIEGIGNLLVS